ncbi:hypothetical protein COO60DRAFT_1016758 [Scenedesmus sp. NREL 46B-D3]|nr:hypothetical protein COO60DRAFT_1016758 [Scenedesmus sp. NREL 46B-D3]
MVRLKNRYLILYVKAKDGRAHESIGPALPAAIRNRILQHQGEAGLEAASASLSVLHYHHLAGVAVVRIARSEHTKVLSSCLKITLVGCKGVNVKLLKLTGAFRVAKSAAAEHITRLMAPLSLRPDQAAAAMLQEKLTALYQ